MTSLDYLFLFILGTAVGSFLNVVILRYDPDYNLLKNINGRSHCNKCGKTLSWYELIPLLSYLIQLGRCRSCGVKLSVQYPIVEFLGGAIFTLVPYVLLPIGMPVQYVTVGLWILVFVSLLILSVIDFRLWLIPDEISIFIAILGITHTFLISQEGMFGSLASGLYHSLLGGSHSQVIGSFLGTESMILWITHNVWLNALAGSLFGLFLFGALYFGSKGRAMGFGDVKLSAAAGLLLGFPDMILATMLAFIIGAIWGVILIILHKKKGVKDAIPFGPFIAIGVTLTFFFGYDIVSGYFKFFSLLFSVR